MNNVVTIFCAFPIFAPAKLLWDRNKDSIVSFINYLKMNEHYLTGEKNFKLDISFGGWCKEQIWFDDLKETIKGVLPQAKVFQFDKNYGKSKIVNEMTFDYLKDNPNTQFLFTCDSDMQFMNSQVHFFDRLVLAANMLQQKSKDFFGVQKPFGFLALNQEGECCHWWPGKQPQGYTGLNLGASYELKSSDGITMNEELSWSQDGAGIAGGAVFCNLLLWKQIGGYRNFNAAYCGDDGHLLKDYLQAGAGVAVIKSLSLIHPTPEDDPEYRKWKDESMKESFNEYDEKKFEKSVEEFEKIVK